MKILLDAPLPYKTSALLRAAGHDVIHADDVGLGTADLALIQMARDQGRVIFTLDADFHDILASEGASRPSVVRLRVQGLPHEAAAGLIERIILACRADLEKGVLVSANQQAIRIRPLPLP